MRLTITLTVNNVLRNPTPFVTGFRLAVTGVLLLAEHDFRIFHDDESGLDESISLPIDDPLASAKLREALAEPEPGNWWYFGPAMVRAWTRQDSAGWVLCDLVNVWLGELNNTKPICVRIRPDPWGWDEQFL